jgi:hypothetical protein
MNRFSPPRPPWVSGDVCDPRNSSSSNNSTECSRGALALVTTPLSTTKHEKLDPLLVSIADARMISGLSRTDLYRRMAAGNIRESGLPDLDRVGEPYRSPQIPARRAISRF